MKTVFVIFLIAMMLSQLYAIPVAFFLTRRLIKKRTPDAAHALAGMLALS